MREMRRGGVEKWGLERDQKQMTRGRGGGWGDGLVKNRHPSKQRILGIMRDINRFNSVWPHVI